MRHINNSHNNHQNKSPPTHALKETVYKTIQTCLKPPQKLKTAVFLQNLHSRWSSHILWLAARRGFWFRHLRTRGITNWSKDLQPSFENTAADHLVFFLTPETLSNADSLWQGVPGQTAAVRRPAAGSSRGGSKLSCSVFRRYPADEWGSAPPPPPRPLQRLNQTCFARPAAAQMILSVSPWSCSCRDLWWFHVQNCELFMLWNRSIPIKMFNCAAALWECLNVKNPICLLSNWRKCSCLSNHIYTLGLSFTGRTFSWFYFKV